MIADDRTQAHPVTCEAENPGTKSVSFVPVQRRRKRLHVARRRIPQREGLCELHNHEQPIARANERPKTRGGGSRLGGLTVSYYGQWEKSKMAIGSVERENRSTLVHTSNAIEGRHRRGTLTWHDVDRSGIFLSCGMDWRL
ncbi:hypothetical protein V8C44DRAFT_353352 [Trichoderma aethiopicum]